MLDKRKQWHTNKTSMLSHRSQQSTCWEQSSHHYKCVLHIKNMTRQLERGIHPAQALHNTRLCQKTWLISSRWDIVCLPPKHRDFPKVEQHGALTSPQHGLPAVSVLVYSRVFLRSSIWNDITFAFPIWMRLVTKMEKKTMIKFYTKPHPIGKACTFQVSLTSSNINGCKGNTVFSSPTCYCQDDCCCHSHGDHTARSRAYGHHGDPIGNYHGDHDENGSLMNDRLDLDDMHDWKNSLVDHC